MKRRIRLLFALLLLLSMFCGCNSAAKPASFDKRTELPEDGIVSASVLEKLKNENKVAIFCGRSGGLEYEWTVFGSDIETPRDTDLALEVLDERDNELVFRLRSENGLGFAPMLSIYPTKNWNAGAAVVYLNDGNGLTCLCTAHITGGKGTALHFSVTRAGTFVIRAGSGENAPGQGPNDFMQDPYAPVQGEEGDGAASGGKQEGQDGYSTDPAPEGKPKPVEPENQHIDENKVHTCTIEIECTAIFNNLDNLNPDKLDVLPKDGVILPKTTVEFYEGESVYDVLNRICAENGIHMEASWTPVYNSVYIEGIHNLYEFDCGSGSGWMYRVNGRYPNYGCSRCRLAQGDVIEWRFTCDLGADIGGGYAVYSEP